MKKILRFLKRVKLYLKCISSHNSVSISHTDLKCSILLEKNRPKDYKHNGIIVTVYEQCLCGHHNQLKTFLIPVTDIALEDMLRLATKKS